MGAYPGFAVKAQFHYEYLKAMLRERNVHYVKRRPVHVVDRVYLEALVERSTKTGHIPSFGQLVQLWRTIGGDL
jgi:hypothetical protein